MTTLKYALLGWPVKHSVSPEMQTAGFRRLGLDATYELIEVPPDELPGAFSRLRVTYAGWNLTVPHKQQAVNLVDTASEEVRAVGSINTVINRDGTLEGHSTDGYGLTTAVKEEFGLDVEEKSILFIGAGGAARAGSLHMAAAGAESLTLVNRTLSKAERLAACIMDRMPECRVCCIALDKHDRIAEAAKHADLLIQATTLGLHHDDPLPIPAQLLPESLAVMDMIYGNTPFLSAASRRGCRTADGRSMLLHQGAKSFELWTGLTAPVESMRKGLESALKR